MSNQKYKKRVSIIVTVFAVVVGWGVLNVSKAQAATYYVAPRADATLNQTDEGATAWTNAANISTPCSAETAMVRAVAGDTVYFRGGTYELGQSDNNNSGAGVLYPRSSGTSDIARITFSAYPGETPILNTTVDPNYSNPIISRAWGDRGQSYTTLKGFTISSTGDTYCGSVGVGDGSVGTTIEDCTFLGSSTPGTNTDNISGVAFGGGSEYAVVSGCLFQDYRDSVDNHNTSAIKTYFAHHLTVTNCEFRNSTVAIYNKQDSDYNIYENNFFYDSKDSILVNVDNIGDSSDGIIENNIIVDSSYVAILLEQNSTNYTPNWTINNNTIYNSFATSRCISINNSTGRYLYNNIIVANASEGEVRFVSGSTIDEDDHNTVCSPSLAIYVDSTPYASMTAWQASSVIEATYDSGCGSISNPGCGSLDSDPGFVAATGNRDTIAEFALDVGSPCLAAGRSGVDMGVDISLVGIQSSPDSTPPIISSFEIPPTFTSLTVPITSFTATDNTSVIGYKLSETSDTPTAGESGWESSPQTDYTFLTGGTKTLYAWAKDAQGNISSSLNASVNINLSIYSLSNFISAITNWLGIGDSNSDVNSDGVVNTRDLGVMMSGWGE